MGHNDYASPNGQWPGELALEPSRLRDLDQNVSEGIDGDAGGVWAPEKPIIIGGSGLSLRFVVDLGDVSTGPRAADGGSLVVDRFPDIGTISVPVTRDFVVPLRDAFGRYDGAGDDGYEEASPGFTRLGDNKYLLSELGSLGFQDDSFRLVFALWFRVGTRPATVPDAMPGFRITQMPSSGAYSESNSDAYVIPTRTNATAYAVGEIVIPSTPNGRQFRCSTAGTSGASQPATFSTASTGDPVSDGTVVWTCEQGPQNAYGHYCKLARPGSVDDYYKSGQAQSISMDVSLSASAPDHANRCVYLDIDDRSGTDNIFHALRVSCCQLKIAPYV